MITDKQGTGSVHVVIINLRAHKGSNWLKFPHISKKKTHNGYFLKMS